MSKKINVDYFRNKLDKFPDVQLPQVKLPKIKSRKIFSTKGPNENVPPPLPKEPPPRTIVDHSPETISTISQMVDGAPTYDYSFGGARVSEEVIERHQREDETASNQGAIKDNDKPAKANLKFSKKLTKHYRELSDFKFKNILGKKTVVKTTMIQVDDYKQRYEDEKNERISDHEDYDFDVDSLPPGSANPSRRCSEVTPLDFEGNESRRGSESASLDQINPQSRRGSETASIRRGRSLIEIPLKSESFNNLDDLDELEEVPPNESSLYRIKEQAEICGSISAVGIDNESPTKDTASTHNSKPSHRQRFDNACGRAKKAVNSKFRKLKQLRTKNTQEQTQDQQEAPPPKVPVRKPTCKKSVKKRSDVTKQESISSVPSVRSEQESLNSPNKKDSLDLEPPRPEWVAKRILSTESKKGTPPHLLRSQLRAQYSMESYDSEREITVTRTAPPPPVSKLQLPSEDQWIPARPVSRLGQHSTDEWGPVPISKLGQSTDDEWGPAPEITKLRQQSVDEWGPIPQILKHRKQSGDEWGPVPSISKLRQESEDEWGPTLPISKLHHPSDDEWGPQLIATKFEQLPLNEWGPPPLVSKLRQPPIHEWGPPPPLPKLQQPSLEEWDLEPPLPDLPRDEWGPAPPLLKVHQPSPDEWSPAPALPKLQQPSVESEWDSAHPLPKVPQHSLEEEWSPTIQKLRQQQSRDEWGPLPPPANQTAVLVHKKGGTFTETPKGHLRKPSMDSNDSDSWIPETYRNMPRQQSGLNKIEEIDTEPWSTQGAGDAPRAPGGCNTKGGLEKSIDIFASEEEGEKAFEDFDDALKNVPVIPIVLRKDGSVAPPLKLQPSLELDDHSQKPLVKQTSLSRQFSDEIEAKNLDIDVNKLITQFEPFPPLEIQKIQVMAIVETAELHYVKNSPTESQPLNGTGLDQLSQFPENQEQQHAITRATAEASAPNPSLESIRASRSRRISAKEWAAKARATRSLESGAYASDEIFYSFEKDHHGVTPTTSPPQRLIKRQVYRIDL